MLRLAGRRVVLGRRIALQQCRHYADRSETMLSSDPNFKSDKPGSAGVPLGPTGPGSTAPKQSTPAASPTPAAPASTTPMPPETPKSSSSTTPPPPPPPPTAGSPAPKAPKRRFRALRVLVYLILASALTYGGAVFFALRNDNFHDFFTEYIPFGEEMVLWFEERSFQKRFPNARQNVYRSSRQLPPTDDSKITIPAQHGLSWRTSQKEEQGGSDVSQKGRHMSAVDANKPGSKNEVKNAQQDPHGAHPTERNKAIESTKKDSSAAKAKPAEKKEAPPPKADKAEAPAKLAEPAQPSPATPSPKDDPRPPAVAPVAQISNLEVPNAEEPVVQELVKIVNDLITVVNSDTAEVTNKYSAPMDKAKESLTQVAAKISSLRDAERQAAEERVKEAHREFDEGAKQLLQRIETAQREDEARFREDFEAERARIANSYEERLKTESERSQALAEQRLQNVLAEQAIEMKRNFVTQIQSLVESEREGRLSKLSDLSTNVDTLTQLTSNWNGVIDSNLATQQLQVGVDSVRAALARGGISESKPQPFVREMAALKLVADGDGVVDAAIASINPSAYQRGIPSQPQLIDRFRRVAGEVRKASLLPENAGVASHVASLLLSKVMFKKQGQPEGTDVESVLSRTETLLEEGDLDGATREMNTLQGWAKVLSRDWLNDARKVLEVRQALDVIEAEARLQCLRVE